MKFKLLKLILHSAFCMTLVKVAKKLCVVFAGICMNRVGKLEDRLMSPLLDPFKKKKKHLGSSFITVAVT